MYKSADSPCPSIFLPVQSAGGNCQPNAPAADESTEPIAHRCVQIPNAAPSSVLSLNVDDTFVSSSSVERGDDNSELAHFICTSMQSDIFCRSDTDTQVHCSGTSVVTATNEAGEFSVVALLFTIPSDLLILSSRHSNTNHG